MAMLWKMGIGGLGTGRRVIWGMASVLLAALSLPGVLMVPLSIEEMAEEAELILQGKVLSRSTQRDDAGRIYTRIELDVAEVWKGAIESKRFVLVHGGGILGEQRSVVSGQADFRIGEEIVAFLVRNPRGEGITLGLAQGKFEVWEQAGVKRARNVFHGHDPKGVEPHGHNHENPAVSPGNKNAATLAGGSSKIISGVLTLEDLKTRVQQGAWQAGRIEK